MMGYFRFALVALLLAGIACVSAIVTMQFAVHRAEVKAPDLRGRGIAQATSDAAALGLDMSVTQRYYSTELPAGKVLLQWPAAGAKVRRGWDVAVAESLGPRRIAIPNVVGKSERSALLLIRQKGLEFGAPAYLPGNQARAETVLAQDPGPHAKGAEAPSVSLLLAAPEPLPTPAWVMPEEQGKPYAESAAELTKAGLHVESATAPLRPGMPAGVVAAQTPSSGTKVDAGTRIVLSVAGTASAVSGRR